MIKRGNETGHLDKGTMEFVPTTASDSELRECPFCGGAAGYIPHTLHNGVRCLTDSCPLSIQAMSKPQWNTRPAQPVDRELDLYHDFARLRNAFLITYDLAGIDASPLPEALPESVYVPGYMDKVRELREVYALVTAAAPLPVETLGDDDTAICPNPSCHKAFSNDMLRDDKRIPTHDFPEPCRSVCPGSGQWPANYAGAKIDALPVDTQGAAAVHWAMRSGVNEAACGATISPDVLTSVIPDMGVTCPLCESAFVGYKLGRAATTQPAWRPSEHTENGLQLLRSIICGGNVLRDFDIFSCNESGHELHCKCFWAQCDEWEKADTPLPAPPTPAGDFCYAKGDEGSWHCGSPKAMHCSVPGDEAFWTSPEGRTHLIACVGDRHLIHHRFVPATPAPPYLHFKRSSYEQARFR